MEQITPAREYKLKIIKITDETRDTKTFRFGTKDVDINFKPGQFFMVRFPNNINFKRPYSIGSSPTEKDYMEIGLNLVGEFTSKLFASKIGEELIFQGPYGKFYFSDDMGQDLILIAGGLGIVPLKSIIQYCAIKKFDNQIKLLYSVKTLEDVAYKKQLDELKEKNPNFDYTITVTRPDGNKWGGKTGRIDESMLKENIMDIGNSLFFICGSLQFSRDMETKLQGLGVRKEQIKRDIWGNYE